MADTIYTTFEDFTKKLNWAEENTVWYGVDGSDLELGTLSTDVEDRFKVNLDPAVNWGMHISERGYVGIRECALPSLYARLGLGGNILERLDHSSLEELVHFGIDHLPENTRMQVPVVDGMANAFLSTKYAVLPTKTVFDKVKDWLDLKGWNSESENSFTGKWNYSVASGIFKLPESKTIQGDAYDVYLRASSSDNGYSSLTFSSWIKGQKSGVELPIMTDMYTVHKAGREGLTELRLQAEIQQLDGALYRGNKKLMDLLSTIVENPKSTMKRVAKACGLPKRDSLEAIESFSELPTLTSAFECYMCLAGILNKDLDWQTRERYQGNLGKALNKGIWIGNDLPGDFAW